MALRSMTKFLIVYSKMGKRKGYNELFLNPKIFQFKGFSFILRLCLSYFGGIEISLL